MEWGRHGNESARVEKNGGEGPDGPETPAIPERHRGKLLGGIALALVVGAIVWIATGDDDSGPAPAGFEARVVDEAELEEIAATSGHPVYWAGPIPGTELEASESEDGQVQVRYLDPGQEPGSDPAGTLAVGSYPLPDAAAALEGFAEREGSRARQGAAGREVVTNVAAPSSTYFADPGGEVQVEVYAPSPGRALRLARSDRVQPVG